ncbi:hypothetical protein CSB37_04155 [bacterium DOLZORAL124_38_8]|nr:MAG: hypothetical protein CSB37_04155 [bacterium DOLZORAL124_38_8]
MSETNNKSKLVTNVLLWGLLFFGVFSFINSFQKKTPKNETPTVHIQSTTNSITTGNLVEFKIQNGLNKPVVIENICQNTEFFRIANDKRIPVADEVTCLENTSLTVAPNKTAKFSVSEKNAQAFTEAGEYFVVVKTADGQTYESKKFEIETPGFFKKLFRTFISQPMFNALVFLTQTLPGKPFGVAIILLTIVVRLLLFYPNQKAMRSQRALQKLQPKLDEVKKKFKGNQQMIAMKTMELYKTHKVNPMSSCLPMLIQVPVMLGVYYSVKDGMAPHLSHFLYSFQANADLTNVNTHFLFWDLANIPWSTFISSLSVSTAIYLLFPLLVAGAQYIAISLTMNTKQQPTKKGKSSDKQGMAEQMQAMTGMMKYVMPVMIGFFAATFPAALGLYWLTSTIFGIFQQKLVNKQLDEKPEIRKKVS